MRLTHHSDEEIQAIYSIPPEKQDFLKAYYGKPIGLWVSVDNEWAEWCECNNFHCGLLTYEINLTPHANILHLKSGPDIDGFSREFRWPEIPWQLLDGRFDEPPSRLEALRAGHINWAAVAMRYQGIIIAPYSWDHRLNLHTPWYYGWDCASGCIWDNTAIESFHLIETEKAA